MEFPFTNRSMLKRSYIYGMENYNKVFNPIVPRCKFGDETEKEVDVQTNCGMPHESTCN